MQHRRPDPECPLCSISGPPVDPEAEPERAHEDALALWREWNPSEHGSAHWVSRVIEVAAELGVEVTPQQIRDHFSDKHRIEQPALGGQIQHERFLAQTNELTDRQRQLIDALFRQRVLMTRQIIDVFYAHGRSKDAAKKAAQADLKVLAQGHFLYRYFPSEEDIAKAKGEIPQFSKAALWFLGKRSVPYIMDRYGLSFHPDYVNRAAEVSNATMVHDLAANEVYAALGRRLAKTKGKVKASRGEMVIAVNPDNWYGPGPRMLAMGFSDLVDRSFHRIKPDGFGTLGVHAADDLPSCQLPFFIEYDHGSRDINDVAAQLFNYHLLAISGAAAKRFPELDAEHYAVPVLMVFSDKERLHKVHKRFKEFARTERGIENGAPILLTTEKEWRKDPLASDIVVVAWADDARSGDFIEFLLRASQPLIDQRAIPAGQALRLDPEAAPARAEGAATAAGREQGRQAKAEKREQEEIEAARAELKARLEARLAAAAAGQQAPEQGASDQAAGQGGGAVPAITDSEFGPQVEEQAAQQPAAQGAPQPAQMPAPPAAGSAVPHVPEPEQPAGQGTDPDDPFTSGEDETAPEQEEPAPEAPVVVDPSDPFGSDAASNAEVEELRRQLVEAHRELTELRQRLARLGDQQAQATEQDAHPGAPAQPQTEAAPEQQAPPASAEAQPQPAPHANDFPAPPFAEAQQPTDLPDPEPSEPAVQPTPPAQHQPESMPQASQPKPPASGKPTIAFPDLEAEIGSPSGLPKEPTPPRREPAPVPPPPAGSSDPLNAGPVEPVVDLPHDEPEDEWALDPDSPLAPDPDEPEPSVLPQIVGPISEPESRDSRPGEIGEPATLQPPVVSREEIMPSREQSPMDLPPVSSEALDHRTQIPDPVERPKPQAAQPELPPKPQVPVTPPPAAGSSAEPQPPDPEPQARPTVPEGPSAAPAPQETPARPAAPATPQRPAVPAAVPTQPEAQPAQSAPPAPQQPEQPSQVSGPADIESRLTSAAARRRARRRNIRSGD